MGRPHGAVPEIDEGAGAPNIMPRRTAAPTADWAARTGQDTFGTYAEVVVPPRRRSEPEVVFRIRLIPAGTFQMGSPETEVGRLDSEGPQHTVTLTQDFWLADAPCTQSLYAAVTGRDPSRFKGADRPVETVSWDDVQAFLQALHERMPRLAMALPSEAQWEYACRAGTTDARYGELNAIAWYRDNAGGQTRLVRQKQANAWGLYDMLGNVWEWCHDGKHRHDHSHAYDPIGAMHEGTSRVLRGGSWDYPAQRVRAAYRLDDFPSRRGSVYGFGCLEVWMRPVQPVQARGAKPRSSERCAGAGRARAERTRSPPTSGRRRSTFRARSSETHHPTRSVDVCSAAGRLRSPGWV